jgi:lactate permease
MPLAFHQQSLDPLGSPILSTFLAALPILVLFYLLVPRRWLPSRAAAVAAVVAYLVAVFAYGMAPLPAFMAFANGVGFGLLPIGWTLFNAMLLYNITVHTGQFDIVRRSVAGLSADPRVQAILIGFAFGAFLEGAAGSGTPVAICAAILVGLGFHPFEAAVLCLIANTSPVAYGGLGTPIITLQGVTDLNAERLSVMAAHQLPFISLFIPLYMVRVLCGVRSPKGGAWRRTFEVWPALLVAGVSFAGAQFLLATSHVWIRGLVLFPMTDVFGGIFALVVTAIFLRFWQPRHAWLPAQATPHSTDPAHPPEPAGAHSAEAAALLGGGVAPKEEVPLTFWTVTRAWTPYAIMSVTLLMTGLIRQAEGPAPAEPCPGPLRAGVLATNYHVAIPYLHKEVMRAPELTEPGKEQSAEKALFNVCWMTSPGSAVFAASILSIIFLRMNREQVVTVLRRTGAQMAIPIPTIAFMLGLSYVTRFAGMDATLGWAFAGTGLLYPFFAPLLGWLGVFLTGTDAGSNALFGSLQKITATQVHLRGAFTHLDLGQAQTLIATSNSTGGVMGKMIDAQSIVVSTAATDQLGREADIFKAVIWHSVFLACLVGAITLLQAYVSPFTWLVPR